MKNTQEAVNDIEKVCHDSVTNIEHLVEGSQLHQMGGISYRAR